MSVNPEKRGRSSRTMFLLITSCLLGTSFYIALHVTDNTKLPAMATVSKEAPALELAPAPAKKHPSYCKTDSGFETILESLFGAMFHEEGFIPPGSCLDIGMAMGEVACHLAILDPERTVYAIDPAQKNINLVKSRYGELPNLQVMRYGMDEQPGTGKPAPGFSEMAENEEFPVTTMDSLFYDKNESMGFAHIDVEGFELAVLKGGINTIRTYRPVFTAELRVHKDPDFSRALLDFINDQGYDVFVVEEVCGWPHMDYRNMLCIPREKLPDLVFSDVFNLALTTGAMYRVTSLTVFDMVYPFCALGAECCNVNNTDDKQCCNERVVYKYLKGKDKLHPWAMHGFVYTKKITQSVWRNMRLRSSMNSTEEAKHAP
jgi:FkbM family methyltransferase